MVISGWLDCIVLNIPSCLSVHRSIPSGWTERATHLTSGQLSKQASPFTLTPQGRKTIDNSLPRVNLCTFGIDPEHWRHTGLSLEPDEYIILRIPRTGGWGGVVGDLFFWKLKTFKKTKKTEDHTWWHGLNAMLYKKSTLGGEKNNII